MNIKTLAYFVTLYSILIYHGIKGAQSSEQEETQWTKQFKLLKKPSFKSIKTKFGDIYDCVDFYKQPAFDHPLLKNHSSHPQMRPSIVPELLEARTFYPKNEVIIDSVQLEDGGCPVGTIPIKRWSKDEFIRMKRFTENYASSSKPNAIQGQPGTHFAIVETNSDPSKVNYNGVTCDMSVYEPKVSPSQYSSGEMIIQNGNDRIQVGWMIYN
ncbi:uncharacterized protein LOC125497913 [Beta vulgaris subsp. vulgaris]|uniref:uncharacterized protein LOC125497913 n=1 Tax=Beta vulgaris subsp. vulgaris TaxID=3555 RepID=UPI0020368FDF|nr:uncharacterized protein LOC125497913 [Beta vulgaris subsp. vulgaris]